MELHKSTKDSAGQLNALPMSLQGRPAALSQSTLLRHCPGCAHDAGPNACRVWAVITSVAPLRAYLFKGGVLPFGSLKAEAAWTATCASHGKGHILAPRYRPAHYASVNAQLYRYSRGLKLCLLSLGTMSSSLAVSAERECAADEGSGYRESDDLIVNLWRNRGDTVIWSVADFEAHLAKSGLQQAFKDLWTSMQRSIGKAMVITVQICYALQRHQQNNIQSCRLMAQCRPV